MCYIDHRASANVRRIHNRSQKQSSVYQTLVLGSNGLQNRGRFLWSTALHVVCPGALQSSADDMCYSPWSCSKRCSHCTWPISHLFFATKSTGAPYGLEVVLIYHSSSSTSSWCRNSSISELLSLYELVCRWASLGTVSISSSFCRFGNGP